jgi:predicted phage tail protein
MTRIVGSGGGGGGGCFLGHTLVAVPSGQRRIDELQPDDLVLSFDHTGEVHEAKILKVHEHEGERVIRYTLWGGQHLDATPNHWVLNQFNAFVEIDTLGTDDCLVDANGHLRPIVGKTEFCIGTVYNLTVEGHHTFIANGVRVHNAGLGLGIAGAGGGGGGGGGKGAGGGAAQRTPTEADDSLQSVQYANVLDLLGEGEIQGIENSTKGIYLDSTPIVDANDSPNFTGYTVVTRNGTQDQAVIPDIIGTESENIVNVEITKDFPVTRSIANNNIDRIRVTIVVPNLQQFQTNGDILATSVSLEIKVQYNGGGFNTVVTDTIAGKTSSRYQRDYIFELTGAFPVDIKVVRTSDDASSARTQNELYWYSYTEIIDQRFRYPNSALAFLRFDSRQFNNIPSRKYLVRGIKVAVPSNATVDTTTHPGRITYAGVWDGTFAAATWTNDPAWCLWDLLTNTRYGASIPTSNLDRYDFYSISQYCNELVDNGKGGLEPRFSCNLLINSRDEVYNVIQEMTSLFRGIAYYGAGSLVLQQDKPGDSQYLLGPSNVVDGIFVYSGTSQKARHTTATVAYQTYESLGEVQYEYVEDADAVSKYGIINKDIKALGCYSQGQAHRAGKWALLSEQNLTETVTFSVSIDSGIILRPGMVIDIADPMKAGTRRSGRVSSATTTAITVDSSANLTVNLSNSPTVSALMPNGLVETKTISSISGTTINVSSAFSEAPNANAIWLIQTSDVEAQQFRVLNVAEAEGGIYGVTALAYNESIYASIESDLVITTPTISTLTQTPGAVSSINGYEYIYAEGSSALVGFQLDWIPPAGAVNNYVVQYRMDDDNWQRINTTAPSTALTRLREGRLYVQIQVENALGKSGAISTATFDLVGKTANPADVQNLQLEVLSDNTARLSWEPSFEIDVVNGGAVYVRHSALTDGSASWNDSVDLVPALPGNATTATIPLVDGEIFVRFIDDGGRLSPNETSIIIDLPETQGKLIVQTRREDQDSPPFQGSQVDVFYDDGYDALTLDGTQLLDSVPDVDALTSFDFMGDITSTGTYSFANALDLGSTFSLDLTRHFVTRGFLPNDTLDGRSGLVDDWLNWDGADVNRVNAVLKVRTTDDNPSGTPTWSAYQEFISGTYKARAFEFQAELQSNDVAQNILIDELGYTATLQRRTENSNGTIASGAGAKAITFDKPFFVGTASLGGVNTYLPSIGITALNMGSGEFFEVTSISSTGFTVTFKNSGGTAVNRNFNWSAVGYGRGG